MIRRITKFLWWNFAFLCAGIIFIASTEIGLIWGTHAISKIVPGQLNIEGLHGRWLGPLGFKRLDYHYKNTHIHITNLDLKWNPWMLYQKLRINDLKVDGITVNYTGNSGNGSSKIFQLYHYLISPIATEIERLKLGELAIKYKNSITTMHDIYFSGNQKENTIFLNKAAFRIFDLVWSGKGQIDLQANMPFALQTLWFYDLPGEAMVRGSGKISGSLKNISLDNQLQGDIRGDLTGSVENVLEGISWNLKINANKLHPHKLHANIPQMEAESETFVTGTPSKLVIAGSLRADGDKFGKWDTQFDINLIEQKWLYNKLSFTALGKDSFLKIKGTSDFNGKLDIDMNWKDIDLPKVLPYSSTKGQAKLTGQSDKIEIDITTDIKGDYLPFGIWHLQGTSDLSSVNIKTFHAQVLDGELSGNADVSWTPKVSWQAHIDMKQIDPGKFSRQWPGNLDGTVVTSGLISDGVLEINIELKDVQGELRSRRLRGSGLMNLSANEYKFKQVKIEIGNAKLNIDGELGKKWLLSWRLNVPDLESIFPNSKGRVYFSGELLGAADKPKVVAKLAADHVRLYNMQTASLNSDLNIELKSAIADLANANLYDVIPLIQTMKFHMKGNGISTNTTQIQSFVLDVQGDNDQHNINFVANTNFGKINTKIKGDVKPGIISGQLQQAQIDIPDFGTWKLRKSAMISLSPEKLVTEDVCLHQHYSRICQLARWEAQKGWQLQTKLEQFPVSLLSDFLPEPLALASTINQLVVNIQSDINQNWSANGSMTTNTGQITYAFPDQEIISFEHNASQADFTWSDNYLRGKFQLTLNDGDITGSTSMPLHFNIDNTWNQQELDLSLQFNSEKIAEFFTLLPYLKDTDGELTATLHIGGSFKQPFVSLGQSKLSNGSTHLIDQAITLKNINIILSQQDNGKLIVDGKLDSGKGILTVKGQIQQIGNSFNTEFKVKGDQVQVLGLKNQKLILSPDLKVITENNKINVSGKLLIPEGRFAPKDLSTAIVASTDEIIIQDATNATDNAGFTYSAKIKLSFGDKVNFKIPGTIGVTIDGKIKGDLIIEENPGQAMLARGELVVAEGEVSAYKQKFEIKKGRFVYHGGPIDNPAVDITAIREIKDKDVIVGIKFRGIYPKLEHVLISDPSMNETEILAYLFTGRSVDKLDKDQGQSLRQMAFEIFGNEVANRIAKRVGIDEVNIKTEDVENPIDPENTQEISLELGKYLSPKLYIGYGITWIEKAQSLNIRYKLGKNISFEASTGEEKSGDILITHETDSSRDTQDNTENNDTDDDSD